jgi:putative surface-exposed virulence protein
VDGVELPLGYDPTNPVSTPAPEALTKVYENAEDGTITGWDINAGASSKTSITNVFDTDRQGRVIKLTGSGTKTSYRLQAYDSSGWHNSRQVDIAWNMKYSENFVVAVAVYTTAGSRTLTYTPVGYDGLGSSDVHHGLGTSAVNGQWQTFTRDLQADLEQAQPGVKILEVNNFQIRGSGLVDDIKLGGGVSPN